MHLSAERSSFQRGPLRIHARGFLLPGGLTPDNLSCVIQIGQAIGALA